METKKNGRFVITDSVQKYKNPWIEVIEDQVIKPDGSPGIFGTVTMKDGISVLPMDDEKYVYLIKEFKYALGREDIEAAGGGIEDNEDSLRAAKRELKEEMGIEAEEWVDLGIVNPFTSAIKSSAKIYLAKKLAFGKDNQEDTENIKVVKVKFEEAVKMVMDSVITHGPSCALILKANEHINSSKRKLWRMNTWI